MRRTVSRPKPRPTRGRFAIVASTYNRRYVDAMLRAARRTLSRAGAGGIEIVRVPGAFEIPAVAARLAHDRLPPLSAILCLGVIFQGETAHARQIGDGVTHALARLQVDCRLPVIHGVYLFDTPEQARVRCLDPKHNRGVELASTALAMARVMASL
jgi:6,7-dimethyl-8-ribityllumazine synthase